MDPSLVLVRFVSPGRILVSPEMFEAALGVVFETVKDKLKLKTPSRSILEYRY